MASAPEPFEIHAFRITSTKKKPSKRLVNNLLERNFPNVASVTHKTAELAVCVATHGSREDLRLFEQALIELYAPEETSIIRYQLVAPAERIALDACTALCKHVIAPTPAHLSGGVGSSGTPSITATHLSLSGPGGLPLDSATDLKPRSSERSVTELSKHYNPGGGAWPQSVCVGVGVDVMRS